MTSRNYVPRRMIIVNTLNSQPGSGARCRLDSVHLQHLATDGVVVEFINIQEPGGGTVLFQIPIPTPPAAAAQPSISIPLGGLICPNGFEVLIAGGNPNANVRGSIEYGVATKDHELVIIDTVRLDQLGAFINPGTPPTHPLIGEETRANPAGSGPLHLAADTDDVVMIIPAGYGEGGSKGVPLLVGYHSHGGTAANPFNLSVWPEICRDVGMIFLSIGGPDGLTWPSSEWDIGGGGGMFHLDAMIQWALDNFNIDPDRIFFSGYSGGGCFAATYAATHRDPTGIMIAGIVSCAGIFDLVQRYQALVGPTDETLANDKAEMLYISSMNATGYTSAAEKHRFQRCGPLHINEIDYAPGSGGGTYQGHLSQGLSLEGTAVWLFYDTQDTTAVGLPHQNDQLYQMLLDIGHSDVQRTKTTDAALPHNWDLLIPKKEDLKVWIRRHKVKRYPQEFWSTSPEGAQVVSYATITPDGTDQFARQRTRALWLTKTIELSGTNNLDTIQWDFAKTMLQQWAGSVGDPLTIDQKAAGAHTMQVVNLSWTPTVVTGADTFTINPVGIDASLHPAVEFTKAAVGTVTIE